MMFKIKGAYFNGKCFPGLNDMLHEAERHPKAYNDMKRKFQQIAIIAIRLHLKGRTAKGRVRLHYEFGEPRKGPHRDYDNICAAGRKIITDALVKLKVIKDDSPEYLDYGTNTFVYTSGEPYILVEIEELNG